MAEFCTCGSIMINSQCSNKNCANKAASKSSTSKTTKKDGTPKKEPKTPRTKRASKCVTYNLYDTPEKEDGMV